MARWFALLAALLLATSCAAGANSAPAAPIAGDYPLTVTDDAGRSVTVPKEPQRIVSLSASNTELVYALGLEGKLVGVDDYSDYPLEAKAKEKIGSFSKPNLEKIVSLAPDLVLATNIHVKTVLPELENRGLRVIVFQPAKMNAVPANLRLLGKVGGAADKGEGAAARMEQRIAQVVAKTKGAPRTRVFFELSPDLISVGGDTFLDDMIAKAGGENIARDVQGAWPKLSPEAVVLKDPEVIILSDHGSESGAVTAEIVRGRPGWAAVAAVKTGRIVLLPDQNLTNRPGPRAVEGLEFIARTLHPDLFSAR